MPLPAELITYGPGSAEKLPFPFLTVPMDYQAEATTLEGFIQQLAVGYLCRGYRYYFQGVIPAGKDLRAIDAKLVGRYGIGLSKFQRCRRKRLGHASVQYLRYGRHFVLLATGGRHDLLQADHRLRDAHEAPIRLGGYAVSWRGGHVQVRIDRPVWKELRDYYLEHASRRPVGWFVREFWRWPYEPWAAVRRQTFIILNQVNRARKAAGLKPVPTSCVRLKRRIYRPFEPLEVAGVADGEGPVQGAVERTRPRGT